MLDEPTASSMILTFTPFEARSASAFEKVIPISPAQ